jgi:hypothetical protein
MHMKRKSSFPYMYTGCSGNNRVCTQVVVGTIMYVHGLLNRQKCTSVQVFWAGADMYKLTSKVVQVTSIGHTGVL